MVRAFLSDRGQALRAALATLPDGHGWRASALCLASFLLVAAALYRFSSPAFLAIRPAAGSIGLRLMIALGLIVRPCLMEELFFRALLLPTPGNTISPRTIGWGLISLLLFVAWHPIRAAIWRPPTLAVFAHPVYLLLAGLLGSACTAAYLASRSIWPAVLIHWLTVATWILFLGGQRVLSGTAA